MRKLFAKRGFPIGICPRVCLALVVVFTSFILVPLAGAADDSPGKTHHQITPGPVVKKLPPAKPLGKIKNPPRVKPVDPKLAGIHATDPIDLKILVLGVPGDDTYERPAVNAVLDRIGIPHDIVDAATLAGADQVKSKLWDGAQHGYYQGVILTRGDLGYFDSTGAYVSAFNSDEWDALWSYESMFKIRQVNSVASPYGWPDNFGLSPVGEGSTDSAPLPASLTSAGLNVYTYLQPKAPISIQYSWVYGATVANPNVSSVIATPLLTAPCPTNTAIECALVSTVNYPDGRENLTGTFANNPDFRASQLLSYGIVNWLTKGLFLGERHVNMNYQADDFFEEDDVWDPKALMDTGAANYTGTLKPVRLTGDDYNALASWQNAARSSHPMAATLMLEMAYNGEGTVKYKPDTLTPVVKAQPHAFDWVSHTYTHVNLDNINAPDTKTELEKNDKIARDLRFVGPTYAKNSLVQPDISGLYNKVFQQAAWAWGIRYLISDTSKYGWGNPTPNAGIYSTLQPGMLIIPRHPTNLFYNLVTPDQWVSEFNCYYSQVLTDPNTGLDRPKNCTMTYQDQNGQWVNQMRPFPIDLNYQQILDNESDWLLGYLINWDIDPVMFHVPNLQTSAGTEVGSLLGDLIEATLDKYNEYYNLPIRNMAQHDVGQKMADRMTYNSSGVTASLVPCSANATSTKLTVKTVNAATIPITGPITAGATSKEGYGGQTISYVKLGPGGSKTLTVSCPIGQ